MKTRIMDSSHRLDPCKRVSSDGRRLITSESFTPGCVSVDLGHPSTSEVLPQKHEVIDLEENDGHQMSVEGGISPPDDTQKMVWSVSAGEILPAACSEDRLEGAIGTTPSQQVAVSNFLSPEDSIPNSASSNDPLMVKSEDDQGSAPTHQMSLEQAIAPKQNVLVEIPLQPPFVLVEQLSLGITTQDSEKQEGESCDPSASNLLDRSLSEGEVFLGEEESGDLTSDIALPMSGVDSDGSQSPQQMSSAPMLATPDESQVWSAKWQPVILLDQLPPLPETLSLTEWQSILGLYNANEGQQASVRPYWNRKRGTRSRRKGGFRSARDKSTERVVWRDGKKMYQCVKCDKIYSTARNMQSHTLQMHSDNPPHQCPICKQPFYEKRGVTRHLVRHHRPKPEKVDDVECYECNICGKQFRSPQILRRHVELHERQEMSPEMVQEARVPERDLAQLHCDVCCKTFQKPSDLRRHFGTRVHMIAVELQKQPEDTELEVAFEEEPELVLEEEPDMDLEDEEWRPDQETPSHEYHDASWEFFDKPSETTHQENSPEDQQEDTVDTQQEKVNEQEVEDEIFMDEEDGSDEEELGIECEVCCKTFRYPSDLKRHMTTLVHKEAMRKRPAEKPFQCSECPSGFHRKISYLWHMEVHSLQKHNVVTPTCTECGKQLLSVPLYKKHWYKCKTKASALCDICGMIIKNSNHLKVHRMTHSEEKEFSCEHCDKKFRTKLNLKTHMEIHIKSKTILCTACGKQFSTMQTCKDHMRTHTGEKPFTCEICGKVFSFKQNLDIHLRTHTGEKPHECKICNKSFSQIGSLKIHQQMHTRIGHFTCKICQKQCTSHSDIVAHMQTHAANKTFQCSICQKRFSGSTTLKTHMRLHDGAKAYMCSICSKTFAYKHYLDVHMRSHTGEKPFRCQMCGKSYSQSHNLKLHTGKVHGVKALEIMKAANHTDNTAEPALAVPPPDDATSDSTNTSDSTVSAAGVMKTLIKSDVTTEETQSASSMKSPIDSESIGDTTVIKAEPDSSLSDTAVEDTALAFDIMKAQLRSGQDDCASDSTESDSESIGDIEDIINQSSEMFAHHEKNSIIDDENYEIDIRTKYHSDNDRIYCHDDDVAGDYGNGITDTSRVGEDEPGLADSDVDSSTVFAVDSVQQVIEEDISNLPQISERSLRFSTEREAIDGGEKPCNICGASFTNPSELKRHLRLHATDDPGVSSQQFECDVCGKKFSFAGVLKRHMRIHLG